MAFTEFCCRSGGSNLNAGTRTGNSTEPGTGADFTYASGSWVASTGVFTVASGNPSTDGIVAGDFASVYPDGSTVAVFIGRVTASSATTITVSLTAKSGTAPTDGTNTRTLRVGGAWLGPNAASGFPLTFIQTTMTNAAGETPRVNLKNDAQYNITASVIPSNAGPLMFQGYTSAYADLGKATIDGGTSGASYAVLNLNAASLIYVDLIFANNGATGNSDLIAASAQAAVGSLFFRCVFHSSRRNGISTNQATCIECEAYNCNLSATAGRGGFDTIGMGFIRCISHDHSGSNGHGFMTTSTSSAAAHFDHCIAESCGGSGFLNASTSNIKYLNCDAYNNTGDGIHSSAGVGTLYIENCNFVKNGGYGIDGAATESGFIINCGFGSGSQANTSGNTNSVGSMVISGSVTYASDVTPWVDPANGDFRINLAVAKGAGRGTFTQTAASYAGTVGYPDIGAGQHLEVAGPVAGGVFPGMGIQRAGFY